MAKRRGRVDCRRAAATEDHRFPSPTSHVDILSSRCPARHDASPIAAGAGPVGCRGPLGAPAPTDGLAQPVWGHAEGLRVGLHPLRGPRGLLRIYAPDLGHDEGRVINYVAVEPIRSGQPHRGLSELEGSKLDGVRGKRFWSMNDPSDATPRDPDRPARGEVVQIDGVERSASTSASNASTAAHRCTSG